MNRKYVFLFRKINRKKESCNKLRNRAFEFILNNFRTIVTKGICNEIHNTYNCEAPQEPKQPRRNTSP